MPKKLIRGLLLLCLMGILAEAPQAASAGGQIFCWLQWGEETVSDGSLEIYRAGDAVPEGYLLGSEFGGGVIAGEDIPSSAFARWISEKAGPGEMQKPTRSGLVKFSGLEPGIYLIRQGEESEHFEPIEPYLACVTQELIQVDTYPKVIPRKGIPQTAESPYIYLSVLGISLTMTGLLISLNCFREKQRSE